jgi:hypothetical protein
MAFRRRPRGDPGGGVAMSRRRVRPVVPILSTALAAALVYVMLAPRASTVALGQPAQDVMQQKLNQAIQTLTNPGHTEPQYQQAISEGMEAVFLSNLVVLPTFGQPAAQDSFDDHTQMTDDLIQALNQHINGGGGTGATKAEAAEARNFMQVAQEAMEAIGQQTQNCNPGNPGACAGLNASDEGGTYDTVAGFQRQVRSPFFQWVPQREPQEDVFVPDALSAGQCVPIVKETRGIQAVVRPLVVPVWINPWFARATVVGTATVWAWEFVPAEFVKTISYCNKNGKLLQTVDTEIIRERGQMTLWRFLRSG